MSSNFTGNPNNLLPQTFIIPQEVEQKDLKIRQYFNDIATAVNSKDSGIYDSIETVTGQQFFPTFSISSGSNVVYRAVLRKVVNFGTLPNTGTTSVAHGITFSNDFSVTKLYAAATDPGTSWIPIPYASPTLANNIELNLDSTNINITTGSNRTNYTRCFVIIEWTTTV